MRRGLIYLTFLSFAFPALGQGQLRFTLPSFASGGGGTGDVVGPASATDNAICRYDGTTGKLLQDSVVTVADTTGNMSWPGAVTLSTAASNGDITLDPHGTGSVVVEEKLAIHTATGPLTGTIRVDGTTNVGFEFGFTFPSFFVRPAYGVVVPSSGYYAFSSSTIAVDPDAVTIDTALYRVAAGVVRIGDQNNAGMAKIGDKGAALPTCNSTYEGVIAYDDDENEFCGCNGSAWAPLDGAGTCD